MVGLIVNDECLDKETAILRQFQERVSDLGQDEFVCKRFLIARDYDLDKAEKMIRSNALWRKETDVKNLELHFKLPEHIANDLAYSFTGFSSSGGPVLWIPLGQWKSRYWLDQGKSDEVYKYVFQLLERCLMNIREAGEKQLFLLLGMEELSYRTVTHMPTLRLLYTGFSALEQNYPEILQTVVIINAPWVFSIGFNFVKPILSKRTMDKIQIFGSDKTQWLPVLQQYIPDKSIPDSYLLN